MMEVSEEKKREWLEANKRVSNLSKKAMERMLVPLVNKAIMAVFELVPAHAADNPWLAMKLVEKGILDPTLDDVLWILEHEAEDELRVEEAIKTAPGAVTMLLKTFGHIINKIKPEWLEKMTYEKCVVLAKKHNPELYRILTTYPKVSEVLIRWLRGFLSSQSKSSRVMPA